MRTPAQHLVTLGVLGRGARDVAVREAAEWAGLVAKKTAEVREAQKKYFTDRHPAQLATSERLESELDELLGLRYDARQLPLFGGGER